MSSFDSLEHILADLRAGTPTTWVNPERTGRTTCDITLDDVRAADARLRRFAPFLAEISPGPWHVVGGRGGEQTGVIDSPITDIARAGAELGSPRLWLKRDDVLPVSGSIKARGGIYEVLATAERIAVESGWGSGDLDAADYRDFTRPQLQELLSQYTIAVGSTGNLGLSIGIMARAMGFHATIHMSADARTWKKAMLRELGAEVVEYPGDYGLAVETGRAQAAGDPRTHFVDDENSRDLFLGYAVAALRLIDQLDELDMAPDAEQPLHVHLPCGVGGAPGGIAYGLHLAFGERAEHVHTWHAEPPAACCMPLALSPGRGDEISVADIGLDGRTAADGLAVGRASRLAWSATRNLVAGAYTVRDEDLFTLLRLLDRTEGIRVEPSALAGVAGPQALARAGVELPPGARHLAWATGGSMVPAEEMATYLSH